jgi:hypothetical protein
MKPIQNDKLTIEQKKYLWKRYCEWLQRKNKTVTELMEERTHKRGETK